MGQLQAAASADVDQLPSRQELLSRFGLFQCYCTPEVSPTGVVSCGCGGCARWQAYVEGRLPGGPTWRQYEVWTRDYVTALAAYLWQRAEQLELERMVILEVGGGDGRLCAHLQIALAATCRAVSHCTLELWCSDSGSNALHASSPYRDSVEILPCQEALAKHRPDIVMCSWMPLGVDWTSSMRACPQVKEYILVGEADGGICGHPVLTWGGNTGQNDSDQAAQMEDSCCDFASHASHNVSSCEALGGDGFIELGCAAQRRRRAAGTSPTAFKRVDLPELSALQLGRTDERWLSATKSRTVSFRRY